MTATSHKNVFLVSILCIGLGWPLAAKAACDDLWLSRNAVFDRAGYCFGSPLGRSVFGTRCGGFDGLTDAETSYVSAIREQEAALGCDVDSNRLTLDVPGLADRLAIETHPTTDGQESACIGWKGRRLELFNTPHARASMEIVGAINKGQTVSFAHNDLAGFSYVTVYENGNYAAQGWAVADRFANPALCEMWAG